MKNLNLKKLRIANQNRQLEYPGSDKITLSFKGLELAGEVGELCNLIKKLVRLEEGIAGTKESEQELFTAIEKEVADVLITLDLLAMYLDINLSKVTIDKFNETSKKRELNTLL